jgi:hypothetical protein
MDLYSSVLDTSFHGAPFLMRRTATPVSRQKKQQSMRHTELSCPESATAPVRGTAHTAHVTSRQRTWSTALQSSRRKAILHDVMGGKGASQAQTQFDARDLSLTMAPVMSTVSTLRRRSNQLRSRHVEWEGCKEPNRLGAAQVRWYRLERKWDEVER